MSSQSTKPSGDNRCPECGGRMEKVIVSETFEVPGGKRVTVDGLMPEKCVSCGEFVYTEEEAQRVREAIAIKLQKAAA